MSHTIRPRKLTSGTTALLAGFVLLAAACSSSPPDSEEGAADVVATTTTSPPAGSSVVPTTTVDTAQAPCPGTATTAHRELVYDTIPGVDPNLLSLDMYVPDTTANCPLPPVMVYVHGGGWVRGDKSHAVADKVSWFNEMGWVFVSVNYRLTPDRGDSDPSQLDPDRIMFPVHNNDVANAISWVHDHAAEFGADGDLISIMGHSAGAGIVAAIATDETYLGGHGLELGSIRCAVPLDTAAYDIRARAESSLTADLYLNAFGDSPQDWDIASPLNHVEAGKDIPNFFVVVRGSALRLAQAHEFADALTGAGVATEFLEATGLSHDGVNDAVGAPDDDLITPNLGRFLEGCR